MANYKCASAGKIPECATCYHGAPHAWDVGQGCANTSWCLDKIRAAGGEVAGTCVCEEAKAEPVSEEGEL
jgi:hypothetical protein